MEGFAWAAAITRRASIASIAKKDITDLEKSVNLIRGLVGLANAKARIWRVPPELVTITPMTLNKRALNRAIAFANRVMMDRVATGAAKASTTIPIVSPARALWPGL